MASVALVSRLQFDPHVRVVDVDESFTMDQVAAACAEPAIGRQARHPSPGKPLRVRRTTDDDSAPGLPTSLTVKQAGFTHYEPVDIYVE
jgi:hypothetical protein